MDSSTQWRIRSDCLLRSQSLQIWITNSKLANQCTFQTVGHRLMLVHNCYEHTWARLILLLETAININNRFPLEISFQFSFVLFIYLFYYYYHFIFYPAFHLCSSPNEPQTVCRATKFSGKYRDGCGYHLYFGLANFCQFQDQQFYATVSTSFSVESGNCDRLVDFQMYVKNKTGKLFRCTLTTTVVTRYSAQLQDTAHWVSSYFLSFLANIQKE